MPSWSYIPYTSIDAKYLAKEPVTSFHPLFVKAAHTRISRMLFKEFKDIGGTKLHFLQRMMNGILSNKYGQQAYLIVLESFGKPLFVVRNVAHTLQDPWARGVYVIRLEDALHIWRRTREEEGGVICWEALVLVGIAGLIGFSLSSLIRGTVPPNTSWMANIRPHALMSFFSAP